MMYYTRRMGAIVALLLGLGLWPASHAEAQTTQHTITLTEFNAGRLQRTQRCMWVLGAWGAANVAVGGIGIGLSKRGENRAFHQMNLGWGLVNLGLAASGIWTASHADPAVFDLVASIGEQHRIERILLFNAGLDVGYIMSGVWLQAKARTSERSQERFKGFGRSIVMQGAFLMAFDLGAYFYIRQNGQSLPALLYPTGQGLGLTIPF